MCAALPPIFNGTCTSQTTADIAAVMLSILAEMAPRPMPPVDHSIGTRTRVQAHMNPALQER